MISKKILNYLDQHKIKYDVLDHRTIYTAYDLANTLKADLRKIAKTLLVEADKNFYLVVLPANYRLDLKKLKTALQVKKVSIPDEKKMVKVLKVKVGGITPFGAMHRLQTVVDKSLLKTQDVIMNAGSFTQSLRLRAKDFLKLEEVKLGNFVQSGGYQPVKQESKKAKKQRSNKMQHRKKAARRAVKKRTSKKKK
ncbi:YbaK/EbsC family protein [Candidatus Falkowbacteria bacterium]|nr:YbaK/EbsC family protein [Candidatus Falkowbacteria bacterium]